MKKFMIGSYLVVGAVLHDFVTNRGEAVLGKSHLGFVQEAFPDEDLKEKADLYALACVVADVIAVLTWPIQVVKGIIKVLRK